MEIMGCLNTLLTLRKHEMFKVFKSRDFAAQQLVSHPVSALAGCVSSSILHNLYFPQFLHNSRFHGTG